MFEVAPEDIGRFDGGKLVELLRRLLYAEAEAAGVPLFNVAAPLQITIADGGEDARIAWTGGATHTDFFPHRDLVFQCKATDPKNAGWKKETWTKSSQKSGQARVLNEAMTDALNRGAAYIGVTATPLVGTKAQDRVAAIKAGVTEAGGDPSSLHSVELYEANRLAAWTNRHRAVALWVKEQQAGMALASFLSPTQWAKRPGMAEPPFVIGQGARFAIGEAADDGLTFEQFSTRLVAELSAGDIRSVRITGASGLGKSRGVFEAVRQGSEIFKNVMEATTIFCDYRQVSNDIWNAANSFSTHRTPLILVVDECPREEAKKLHEIAAADGSRFRVVTIDTDGRSLGVKDLLAVKLRAADEDVISSMLLELFPKASPEERAAIFELCAGFPRIAVLAARGIGEEGVAFNSESDAAQSILKGAGLTDPADLRALGTLSLFDRLSFDKPPEAFNAVANQLSRMTGDELFDRLVTAVEAELAGRYGSDLAAQPRPIANYLALQRLNHLRPSTIRRFLAEASHGQADAMLRRFRYLRQSPTLRAVVSEMLGFQGDFGQTDRLLTPEGARLVDAFVHVSPDVVADAIHYAVQDTSIDDLKSVRHHIGGVRDALQRLAVSRETFPNAMLDLLRLSAAEFDDRGGAASELVEQLFHLRLSGTAAPSTLRFAVLDEVLRENDPSLLWACGRALEGGLELDRFMRFGANEGLGNAPPVADWAPETGEEVINHLTSALDRLTRLRGRGDELADQAERAVATRLRRLLWPELLGPIKSFINAVVADRGFWPEAAKSIGDWLYFDRSSRDEAFGREVRRLYDTLLPTEPEARAVVFSQFWSADFRDPEAVYRPGVNVQDYDWAARQAAALAPEIAGDPDRLKRVVAEMAGRSLHSPSAFTDALAPLVTDPVALFRDAVTVLDERGEAGISFVLSLLHSLENAHPAQGNTLADVARASTVLSSRPILVHTALKLTASRLQEVAQGVHHGDIAPGEAVPLSYGRRMEGLAIGAIAPLLNALVDRSGGGGTWAAIEILSMFLHGRVTVSAEEAAAIKRALLAPLGNDLPANAMSGHAYGVLVGLLNRGGFLDAAFASEFTSQIIALAQVSTGWYGTSVAEALQEALEVVLAITPDAVWRPIAGFYEVASRAERRNLQRVVSKQSLFAEGADAFDAGLLFAAPTDDLLDWAAEDPERRVSFLVSFFPILQSNGDAGAIWHPAFVTLVNRFGEAVALGQALRERIFPSSWSGSMEAYLSPYRAPLATWTNPHPLALWAEKTLLDIDRHLKAGW